MTKERARRGVLDCLCVALVYSYSSKKRKAGHGANWGRNAVEKRGFECKDWESKKSFRGLAHE